CYEKRRERKSDFIRPLAALVFEKLSRNPPNEFLTQYLHQDNPFGYSHMLLDRLDPKQVDVLFSRIREKVEQFGTKPTGLKYLYRRFVFTMGGLSDSERWWRKLLRANGSDETLDSSKTALLLAYELQARGLTVDQLHQRMQQHRVEN